MNRERAAHGLGPLRLEPRLTLAASDRIGDMMRKRYFDHVSPDGVQPFTWVRKRGYRYRTIGENLALGYRSSQSVVTGWMNMGVFMMGVVLSGLVTSRLVELLYRGKPAWSKKEAAVAAAPAFGPRIRVASSSTRLHAPALAWTR